MSEVPHAIGIIMDGNRRWAKEKGLDSFGGHIQGRDKIKDLLTWAQDAGVKEITLYAFSSENWKRSPEEVSFLLNLLESSFDEWIQDAQEKNVKIRVLGNRNKFSKKFQEKIVEIEEKTKGGEKGTLVFALSYGGREEILAAVNALDRSRRVTAEEFSKALWSAGLADPDLIIRTGGEKRLSNFLPWQSVYAELFFTDTKWPDFSEEEFKDILAQYAQRQRRFGA